ncbi:MAG: CRISPR-associated endonuclease Cas1 [Candidatus Coatesbacteria bacterium]|nr:CRISPR-associated endonuclease Cas1 [Candidatus Coatesbacteria bacterium]
MSELETLWPVRNVAEYAYCPRLFYLMEVEGTFLPSVDTEEGVAVHRRVDKPSRRGKEAAQEDEVDPLRPKSVRSLTLSSERLGIIGILDLAEVSGKTAIPVEYRKGRPMRVAIAPPPEDPEDANDPPLSAPQPWPTDRVQVALQALLLEDAGYDVPRAVLYYSASRLRLDLNIDEELKDEALRTLSAAQECAKGSRPQPLVNDPKCPKCSLQPICLPDEINLQRAEEATDELTPRKIWPLRDDGMHVVVQSYGSKVGVRGESLNVTDKDGRKLQEVPIAGVESVSLLGPVQISTQALSVLAEKGVPIAYLSAAGRLVAMVDPMDSVSARVRRGQVLAFCDVHRQLALARAVIAAKIMNQRTLLMRNHPSFDKAVGLELAHEAKKAAEADSVESIRGHEGQAAAIYFKHFAGMLKCDVAEEFAKNGRQRRPPPDPVNSCISMGYSMLTHECTSALRTARLEPSIGAFHVSRPGRPALSLDLMEPFRPLVADSVAIGAFNKGELRRSHFLDTAAGCVLTSAGRRAFFTAYARRMDTDVTHPVFEYRLSYRRMIMLHARMIAAWVVGDIDTLAFLTTR